MKQVVLDCSATMAWCFKDQADSMTDKLLDSLAETTLIVPAIWPLEVANVLLVAERNDRLSLADSTQFLDLVGTLPLVVEGTGYAHATGPVLSIARQTGLSSYDAAYLELAMRAGAPLASRHRGLRRAGNRVGVELFA